jgi:putative effector of murein hydrolase LrgA (UPF0299 family)
VIEALAILLLCQLAGEVLVQVSGIPVPGPVVGMALLFLGLWLRGSLPEPLRDTGQTLISHLALMFVPAGVGVMLYFERVSREWPAILVALLISTLATITITALVMAGMMRLRRLWRRHDHG